MTKLLDAYRKSPTLANAERLRRYVKAHPMALLALSVKDTNLLSGAILHADLCMDLEG